MKKKILGWLGSPPLLMFNLLIKFEKDIKVLLSDGKTISQCVQKYYQNEPSLQMSRQKEIKIPTKLFAGQGLTYSDNEGKNSFTVGKDFLRFQFKQYPNWNTILKQVSDILFKLKGELGLKVIAEISLLYIDRFIVKNKNNVINKNFNLEIEFPLSYEIDYTDFTFGYVVKKTKDMKFIQRLKGRVNEKELEENQIYYILENDYRCNKNIQISTIDNFKKFITSIHDEINDYFIDLIKDKIGSDQRYGLQID
ncbi:MAG: TIGR04255 family protein [Candidatus Lokiarchaeota archaeon]|nr:TIGR04255 family protein [Candidatus Lokiarchaeota archaeon]